MKKLLLLVIAVWVPSLFITGCGNADNLLTKKQNVEVTLDSFNLSYDPSAGSAPLVAEATTGNNPSCGSTSLNSLLSANSDWNDIADRVKKIELSEVRYKVTNNTTPVAITGKLTLTDPDTGDLTAIGEGIIDANTNIDVWTPLPFAEKGQNIVNYYLAHRDATFEYCAEGTPNDGSLSLTLEIQLGTEVTVKVL